LVSILYYVENEGLKARRYCKQVNNYAFNIIIWYKSMAKIAYNKSIVFVHDRTAKNPCVKVTQNMSTKLRSQ
jgi:hypothetical protein